MRKLLGIMLLLPLFAGCGAGESVSVSEDREAPTVYIQEAEQLYPEGQEGYVPLNYRETAGKWFPYMGYEDYMTGKSEEDFRLAVRELYSEAKAEGINTLYLHVHPCGDAYYRSDIFPQGECLDGDYDPLEIMLAEAHSLGMSAHAWLNPLRCQSSEQMDRLSGDFIVKRWVDDESCHIAKLVGGRWYLDPSYIETDKLLCRCITELTERYDVDGIQIDDYFYPTADESFDHEEFLASGAQDLAQWRLGNCSRMVRAMYEAVKKCNRRVEFGISPQGSLTGNYESQYADVRLWCREKGYCDYIVPQLYFGFENEICPFAETFALWESLVCPDVRLIAGLAPYKLGKADKWAGAAGENEWLKSQDIIERQIVLVKESKVASGYALYG
jgi:uncharacterized lipoprotein YddW (UPF0748 family)